MTDLLTQQPAPGPGRVSPRRRVAALVRGPGAVVAIALVTGLLWLPNLTRPLSSDEGGFLIVASQWSPGDSLYGNYWVDRPPLLIVLFELAHVGGGMVALRLLGLTAIVLSVLLAGRIGALAAPTARWAPPLVAATGGVFSVTPRFGANAVDGELLAVPLVLASILGALLAVRGAAAPGEGGRRQRAWWVVAGASAMAALLVKQSMADGFILAATVVLWLLAHARVREAARAALSFALGAGAMLGTVLAWADSRGTTPAGLWRAVVVFRADAAAVISTQASAATPARARELAMSFLASGAVVVLLAALVQRPRRPRRAVGPVALPDLRLLAAAVLAWELVAVISGGSYWLHYLIGLVPGLVLSASAVAAHRPRRGWLLAAGVVYATVSAVTSTVELAAHDRGDHPSLAVERYLIAHARPGDTGVVAFGEPALLQAAGLSSPYPHLWSLPVRVLDPHLVEFTAVITGPERPTWAIVNGSSLATWGVDARAAQPAFDREYRLVDVEGDYEVFRLRRPPGTG